MMFCKMYKKAIALGLAVCLCVPVSASAAVSAAAASPALRLDAASCEVAAGGGYTLAVTAEPDTGAVPEAYSTNGDCVSVAYAKKDGAKYLYSIKGIKQGLSSVFIRLNGAENGMSVFVGAETGTVNVKVPEGRNLRETAEFLERSGVCTMKQLLDVANSPELDAYPFISAVPNAEKRYYKAEGYLIGDTYNFWKRQNPVSALKTMLDNFQNKTASVDWNNSYGMTREQMITFASIVQAESGVKDMAEISSVFHNRLQNGASVQIPKLQSNATSFYPFRAKANIPAQFGNYKSTYDTYTIAGLPAGPVCSPTLAAINAALHPGQTSYYYFCHGKDGTAYYAETLDQHKANLVKAGLREA